MTGQNFQERLDAIVSDLQTTGKGQSISIPIRESDNSITVLPLSSDVNGVVNVAQLAEVQAWVDTLGAVADEYTTERAPVMDLLEDYNTARGAHQALIDAASAARVTLNTALENDAAYQTAKTALETARQDADYIDARTNYENNNVSQNYAAFGSARGEYAV